MKNFKRAGLDYVKAPHTAFIIGLMNEQELREYIKTGALPGMTTLECYKNRTGEKLS